MRVFRVEKRMLLSTRHISSREWLFAHVIAFAQLLYSSSGGFPAYSIRLIDKMSRPPYN